MTDLHKKPDTLRRRWRATYLRMTRPVHKQTKKLRQAADSRFPSAIRAPHPGLLDRTAGVFDFRARRRRQKRAAYADNQYEAAMAVVEQLRMKRDSLTAQFEAERAKRLDSIANARKDVERAKENELKNLRALYVQTSSGISAWNLPKRFGAWWNFKQDMLKHQVDYLRDPVFIRTRRLKRVRKAELRVVATDFMSADLTIRTKEKNLVRSADLYSKAMRSKVVRAQNQAVLQTGKNVIRRTFKTGLFAANAVGVLFGAIGSTAQTLAAASRGVHMPTPIPRRVAPTLS